MLILYKIKIMKICKDKPLKDAMVEPILMDLGKTRSVIVNVLEAAPKLGLEDLPRFCKHFLETLGTQGHLECGGGHLILQERPSMENVRTAWSTATTHLLIKDPLGF